jgi:hypothetical protein
MKFSSLQLQFPEPTGINVNMLPIDLLNLGTLPVELQGYSQILGMCVRDFSYFIFHFIYMSPFLCCLDNCLELCAINLAYSTRSDPASRWRALGGKVSEVMAEATHTAYLTIDEKFVASGECHRRPGIHTDSPGMYIGTLGWLLVVGCWLVGWLVGWLLLLLLLAIDVIGGLLLLVGVFL